VFDILLFQEWRAPDIGVKKYLKRSKQKNPK